MHAHRTLLAGFVAFTLAPAPLRDELRFAPAPETSLRRTFTTSSTLALVSQSVSVDGEELPAEELGVSEATIESHERRVVTDRLDELDGEQPRRLVRTFEELEATQSLSYGEEEPFETRATSALEGRRVVFTRDPESGRQRASFPEGESGDERLLAGLEEDMDLRALLPGHALAPGESFELEPSSFEALLAPGGDVQLLEEGEEPGVAADEEQLAANTQGSFVATYVGTREEGGVRVAVLRLVLDVSTFEDEALPADEVPAGFEGSRRTELASEVEGELLWDVEHGHAQSLSLSGTQAMTLHETLRGEVEGRAFEQLQRLVFSGPFELELTLERP